MRDYNSELSSYVCLSVLLSICLDFEDRCPVPVKRDMSLNETTLVSHFILKFSCHLIIQFLFHFPNDLKIVHTMFGVQGRTLLIF